MSEHFIKNIEIENFKCFKDFKAEGFSRVNLIGGKNNVGKTAFMEACFLSTNLPKTPPHLYQIDEIEKLKKICAILEFHRDSSNFLLTDIKIPFKFKNSYFKINNIIIENYHKDFTIDNSYKKEIINNLQFISILDIINQQIINAIDEIKLLNKDEELNILLKELFNIEKIDIIHGQVMLKNRGKYLLLNEFGDGIKHFLIIILALYLNKNNIIYFDEIENGLHYSKFDKLWKIILTISKQQNVQVFATTHSKECIESYARVAKKLEDKEISFIELCRKEKEIRAFIYPYDWFIDEIEQQHEVRGCL
jgi:AAA15 family ATPase/GTPase